MFEPPEVLFFIIVSAWNLLSIYDVSSMVSLYSKWDTDWMVSRLLNRGLKMHVMCNICVSFTNNKNVLMILSEVLEEGFQVPASIAERYKVGRTIGDGNFAIVKECIERWGG